MQAICRPQRLDYALSAPGLYEAAQRCFSGTRWKTSAASFELNCWERCLRLSEELADGSYAPGAPRRFTLTRPKRRECVSVAIRDRVVQRSLNDNVVYPAVAKSLVKENCACQSGKGTDYARDLLERQLKRWHHHHGTEGYVFAADVAGYYPNMSHAAMLDCFARHLEPRELEWVEFVLSARGGESFADFPRGRFRSGRGVEPGSQLVQIAGIALLSPLDHMAKERLQVKGYVRYMDDMLFLCESRERAAEVRGAVAGWLDGIGYGLNARKSHIQGISQRIPFLGFTFELKASGKVVRRVKPEKAGDQRRRLRRILEAERAGRLPPGTAEESFGTMHRYLQRNCTARASPEKLRTYWESLEEGKENGL